MKSASDFGMIWKLYDKKMNEYMSLEHILNMRK